MGIDTAHRKRLRVLLVEDSAPDAELLLVSLAEAGYDPSAERVQTAEGMRRALARGGWQIILSDYSLPTFSAPEALAIAQELQPELPFIIVSGTVGEDTAVSALKAGASDFLIKGRLTRLAPAICARPHSAASVSWNAKRSKTVCANPTNWRASVDSPEASLTTSTIC